MFLCAGWEWFYFRLFISTFFNFGLRATTPSFPLKRGGRRVGALSRSFTLGGFCLSLRLRQQCWSKWVWVIEIILTKDFLWPMFKKQYTINLVYCDIRRRSISENWYRISDSPKFRSIFAFENNLEKLFQSCLHVTWNPFWYSRYHELSVGKQQPLFWLPLSICDRCAISSRGAPGRVVASSWNVGDLWVPLIVTFTPISLALYLNVYF